MSVFKYGDLTISIEPLQKQGEREEYGIRFEVPGREWAFRAWYPEERDHEIVAQVAVYDMIEAYEDPQRFAKRKGEESQEFLRAVGELVPYLHGAHLAIHKAWGYKPYSGVKELERGPREWMPTKRKN